MIDVIDLVKSHGATKILCGVSLSVARGEVAAIIGSSGRHRACCQAVGYGRTRCS